MREALPIRDDITVSEWMREQKLKPEQYGKYYYFVNSWGDTPSFSVSLGSSEYYIWVNAGIFYSFNGAIYNWK